MRIKISQKIERYRDRIVDLGYGNIVIAERSGGLPRNEEAR